MPRLLELCVCYWVLSSPARVGIIFAFLVGILISLIEGSLVGAASMGLSIVAYVLLHNIYTIRQLDWISQTAVIFLLLGISVALQRVVLAAMGVPSDGLGYLIAVVISALLWRPLTCSSIPHVSGLGNCYEAHSGQRQPQAARTSAYAGTRFRV